MTYSDYKNYFKYASDIYTYDQRLAMYAKEKEKKTSNIDSYDDEIKELKKKELVRKRNLLEKVSFGI